MAEYIKIYEVGPRDGLQNEPAEVSTSDKEQLVTGLIESGLRSIELTSFVSQKAIPQLADAEQLAAYVAKYPKIQFPCLVINEKGYERAKAAGVRAIATVLPCSEAFSEKNNRMSIDQTLAVISRIMQSAKADKFWTRIYLSTAWVCPYQGQIAPAKVLRLLEAIAITNPDEIALADTIGQAHPKQVAELFESAKQIVPIEKLAAHLHDTSALGLVNSYAALQTGVHIFDTSVGGLGGCPFAPGAAGNLATEDFVLMAERIGFATGVDLNRLWSTVELIGGVLGRRVGGRTRGASPAKRLEIP